MKARDVGIWLKEFNKIQTELENIRRFEMYQAYVNSIANNKV
jgi:hypothetical protein